MEPKPHLSYAEQLERLKIRGMSVGADEFALATLERVGYYTFSGYSHSFRFKNATGARTDNFRPGTTFENVHSLWDFDNKLRSATFGVLQHIETHLRSRLVYALGAVNPMIHRMPELLQPDNPAEYPDWLEKLDRAIRHSRDDSIVHHRNNRDSVIPVWVAMDVLDWGGLTYLYGFAPRSVRDTVASHFGLTAPQLRSWMKALNIVRNICAHHSRFFNRHYSLTARLPRTGELPELDHIAGITGTSFAMLTLLQHLGTRTQGVNRRLLPAVLARFPDASGMNIQSIGAPDEWDTHPLWR